MTDTPRSSIGARRNPESEAAILDAAAEIIAEKGFAKLTMEAVARRGRAGKATVYRWWPSRGHLLLALYSRSKLQLEEANTGDLETDLTHYIGQMLTQLWTETGGEPFATLLRLLIAEAQFDPTIREALQRERHERWVHIDNIVRRAQERGQLNPALSLVRAEQRIISMIWYLLLNDSLPRPEQAGELVAAVLCDLRA